MKLLIFIGFFVMSFLLGSCKYKNQENKNEIENISEVKLDTSASKLVDLIEKDKKDSKNIEPNNFNKVEIPEEIDTIGDCEKCDGNLVLDIERNINKLNEEQVRLFLCTFSPLCEDKAEFREFSNEVLFKLCETNAKLFFKVLIKEQKDLHIEIILEELANPINDLIDIRKIKKNIHELNVSDESIKKKVEDALNKAPEY